ncbi:MAG: AAA family ATPase [Bacteroidia bacterium]|nr:AAA family ATPase [Bacteroidia bacterium]
MGSLVHTYDIYGAFQPEKYFAHYFNTIPSRLNLEVPLEISKDNTETVLQELDFETYNIKLLHKGWHIHSKKNVVESKNFLDEYFYTSAVKEICIYLLFRYENLYLNFFYNATDPELEQWVLSTYQEIRDKFGEEQDDLPEFKVLAKRNGCEFYIEDVTINALELDIEKLYNNDFAEVHKTVHKSLQTDTSGLILLHGPPGTGKTSYIKYLLSLHRNRNFIFIPNDFVKELLQPEFITFLIRYKDSILVIEDAEKVITSRENNENSVVSTILQLTDGLFRDYLNIKIICTFNISIEKVDKALLRKGRMIAFYEFKELSLQKTNALLHTLGYAASETPLPLAEIFNPD